MVKKDTGWQPAYFVGKDADDLKVRFVGSDGEAVTNGENVRHLFAGSPDENIPPGLFKKK
jgi:hypothetical protein